MSALVAAGGDAVKGLFGRRELRRGVEKVTQAAVNAATVHGWILATAYLQGIERLVKSNEQMAANFTDKVVKAIADGTGNFTAMVANESAEWRDLVDRIAASYQAHLISFGHQTISVLLLAIAVGLGCFVFTRDSEGCLALLSSLWWYRSSVGLPHLLVACTIAACARRVAPLVHAGRIFFERMRFHMELTEQKQRGWLKGDDDGLSLLGSRHMKATQRIQLDSLGALTEYPLFSCLVTKHRSNSHVVVSGVLTAFAPHSGASLSFWRWEHVETGAKRDIPAQLITYSSHASASPTLAVIDDRATGVHRLTLVFKVLGNAWPAKIINPIASDYSAHLIGSTSSDFWIQEFSGPADSVQSDRCALN